MGASGEAGAWDSASRHSLTACKTQLKSASTRSVYWFFSPFPLFKLVSNLARVFVLVAYQRQALIPLACSADVQ